MSLPEEGKRVSVVVQRAEERRGAGASAAAAPDRARESGGRSGPSRSVCCALSPGGGDTTRPARPARAPPVQVPEPNGDPDRPRLVHRRRARRGDRGCLPSPRARLSLHLPPYLWSAPAPRPKACSTGGCRSIVARGGDACLGGARGEEDEVDEDASNRCSLALCFAGDVEVCGSMTTRGCSRGSLVGMCVCGEEEEGRGSRVLAEMARSPLAPALHLTSLRPPPSPLHTPILAHSLCKTHSLALDPQPRRPPKRPNQAHSARARSQRARSHTFVSRHLRRCARPPLAAS